MVNSRQKGARGERELAAVLGDLLGVKLRRGQQYCGLAGNADVVGLPGVSIECKRVESLNVSKAMQQAIRDAKGDDIPMVAHRKNNEDWLATVQLADLVDFAERVLAAVPPAEIVDTVSVAVG